MFAPTFIESSTVSSEGSTESSEIFFHIAETETSAISSYEAEAGEQEADDRSEQESVSLPPLLSESEVVARREDEKEVQEEKEGECRR